MTLNEMKAERDKLSRQIFALENQAVQVGHAKFEYESDSFDCSKVLWKVKIQPIAHTRKNKNWCTVVWGNEERKDTVEELRELIGDLQSLYELVAGNSKEESDHGND